MRGEKTVYSAIYFSNKTAGYSLWSSYWNTSYGVLSPGIQNQWDFLPKNEYIQRKR